MNAHAATRLSPSPWLVLLAALVVQLPLVLNPGYFSHDELQWAAYAQDGVRVAWRDLGAFQYRPLTFNLWMQLSRWLFEAPMLFHAVLAGWGALNAAMLAAVGRGFGMRRWPAALGALAFVLTPYAAYTHGWVGCIADLVWLSCALAIALVVQHARGPAVAAIAAALLTAAALLGKEAAFAIPPLLAVAWWFDGRRPRWLAATLAAGLVAALYLWLRLDILLHAPRQGGQYSLSLVHVPVRWLEYQLFPPLVPALETFNTLLRPLPALLAGILWLGLVLAIWQAGRRLLALFLAAGIAALAPVLPMAASFNHYAYGFAAVVAMVVAAAWSRATPAGRAAIATFAGLTALHAVVVMAGIHQVGRIQAVFSPALAVAVQAHRGPMPLALQLEPDAREWVFRRLTHHIPHYRGVPIGDRVRLVAPGEPADYRVAADGTLRPIR